MNWQEVLTIITLLGVVISIVMTWSKKNTSQDIDIIKMQKDVESNCKDVVGINKHIGKIYTSLNLIKENDLKHIEKEMGELKGSMIRIETVLKERLPSRSNGFKK